ncbi:MAG: metal ABC transporter permease [Saprospiraceae bacterium]|nr:metal ABC transporter permease [Saprospiraceae bacterium]
MASFLEILTQPWAIRAITASVLVGLTCGVLGVFIVLRNMSLLGDALSHSVLPGIVISFMFFGYNPLGFFIGALGAGLLSTSLITWVQQNAKTRNDAAIGIVFTVMFSLGIIGISWLNNTQNVHLDLKDFLFGNVLAVSPSDVNMSIVVCLYSITMIILFYRYLFATTFQPVVAQVMGISVKATHYLLMFLLSFAVVSAMRTVGVILVVAMLITPASTALLYFHNLKKVIILSGILGIISAIFGFILAVLLDSNPGPMMVLVAGLLYTVSVFLAPEKGYIRKWWTRKLQNEKVINEDIVKYLHKHDIQHESDYKLMSENLDLKMNIILSRLKSLDRSGMVNMDGGFPHLTVKGVETADEIVRAHRLWETFQVNKMGMNEEQIHQEAERLEHKLTRDIVDEVDEKLGYPSLDPHGSPIPPKKFIPEKSLISLNPQQKGKIAQHQLNHDIEGELWELGLMPETSFSVYSIEKDQVVIEALKKRIIIPAQLARQINVI